MNHTMQIKLLGVRGTVPVHGPQFTSFGGGTSSVLIRAGEENFILDAGTGLSGEGFRSFCPGKQFRLLISHSHVDHLIGFPIFPLLFDGEARGDVYLKTRQGRDAKAQIEALMAPPLWPIRTDGVKATLTFRDVPDSFLLGAVRVDTMDVNHPGGCTAYKLTYKGICVVYATDIELTPENEDAFAAFAANCDLLLLDSQYLDEEYAHTRGFGHSTISRSAAMAARCGAAQTIFIHHDPTRTDAQLLALEASIRGSDPRIHFGRGGEEICL